jgi:hypothetical protein
MKPLQTVRPSVRQLSASFAGSLVIQVLGLQSVMKDKARLRLPTILSHYPALKAGAFPTMPANTVLGEY